VAVSSAEFEAISPGLPAHQDEVMTAHQGAPSIAQQNATHGSGLPPLDKGGPQGAAKYDVGADLPPLPFAGP